MSIIGEPVLKLRYSAGTSAAPAPVGVFAALGAVTISGNNQTGTLNYLQSVVLRGVAAENFDATHGGTVAVLASTRAGAAAYSAGTAYTAGNRCVYSDRVYQARDATTGNAPSGTMHDTTHWRYLWSATSPTTHLAVGADGATTLGNPLGRTLGVQGVWPSLGTGSGLLHLVPPAVFVPSATPAAMECVADVTSELPPPADWAHWRVAHIATTGLDAWEPGSAYVAGDKVSWVGKAMAGYGSLGGGLNVVGHVADPARMRDGPDTGTVAASVRLVADSYGAGNNGQITALSVRADSYDPAYSVPGTVVALQAFGMAHTSYTGTGQPAYPFGADIKARVSSEVRDASHPAFTGLETGGGDASFAPPATNGGVGLRVANQGNHHLRNLMVLRSAMGGDPVGFGIANYAAGTFENGLVISTNAKANPPQWSAGTTYGYCDVVRASSTPTSLRYECISASCTGIEPGVTAGWETSWQRYQMPDAAGVMRDVHCGATKYPIFVGIMKSDNSVNPAATGTLLTLDSAGNLWVRGKFTKGGLGGSTTVVNVSSRNAQLPLTAEVVEVNNTTESGLALDLPPATGTIPAGTNGEQLVVINRSANLERVVLYDLDTIAYPIHAAGTYAAGSRVTYHGVRYQTATSTSATPPSTPWARSQSTNMQLGADRRILDYGHMLGLVYVTDGKETWVTGEDYVAGQYVLHDGADEDTIAETYRCLLAHTSAAGSEPGVGGSWATYWTLDEIAPGTWREMWYGPAVGAATTSELLASTTVGPHDGALTRSPWYPRAALYNQNAYTRQYVAGSDRWLNFAPTITAARYGVSWDTLATFASAPTIRNHQPAAYDSAATYTVGAAVTHSGSVYRCTVACGPEAWTAGHWTATTPLYMGITYGLVDRPRLVADRQTVDGVVHLGAQWSPTVALDDTFTGSFGSGAIIYGAQSLLTVGPGAHVATRYGLYVGDAGLQSGTISSSRTVGATTSTDLLAKNDMFDLTTVDSWVAGPGHPYSHTTHSFVKGHGPLRVDKDDIGRTITVTWSDLGPGGYDAGAGWVPVTAGDTIVTGIIEDYAWDVAAGDWYIVIDTPITVNTVTYPCDVLIEWDITHAVGTLDTQYGIYIPVLDAATNNYGIWSDTACHLASLTLSTALPVNEGGTGGTTPGDAQTNLGLVVGADVQQYNANLAAIAGLTTAANQVVYWTGAGTAATTSFTAAGRALAGLGTAAADYLPYMTGASTAAYTTLTSAGRALIDDADAAAQRTTLGLALGTNTVGLDGTDNTIGGYGFLPFLFTTDTAAASPIALYRRQRTTGGAVSTGDQLGGLQWQGARNSTPNWLNAAAIRAYADENFDGPTKGGGRIEFATTPNVGSGTLATRLVLDNAGKLYVGSSTSATTSIDQSGNTLLAGTLGVTGTTSVAALNLSGALALATNKFTCDTSGNAAFAGTLGVTGKATITGPLVTTSAAKTITLASDTIPITASVVALNNTTAAGITLTSTPTIADGVDGQVISLVNVSATYAVSVQDQGTLAGSNLRLVATPRTMGPRDSLQLIYSSAVGDWIETGYNNVI